MKIEYIYNKVKKGMRSQLCMMHYALCLAAAGTLLGCTFEQEDYFDETAALRVTHLNQKIKERLVQQSAGGNHGWVIQYFVAGTDDNNFEGFNLFGDFKESGSVTLAGNHRFLRNGNANKYTEDISTFKMLGEEGPVLSFDTWNDILTVFEDPVDPSAAPSSLVNDGEGMNGDHNLVMSSFKDDEIVFLGERHRAQIRFIPCDLPWEEYIQTVTDMKNKITNTTLTSYYVTNGTDTMYFSRLNRGYFNYVDRLDDPLKNKVLSCVFTPEGFRLHRVDSLSTNAFQEFTLADDESCLLNEDRTVQVIPCWDKYIVNHTAVWKMDTELFSAEQKSLYGQINEAFKTFNSSCSLASIGIGKSSGANSVTGLVLTFYTNTAGTKTNTVGLSLTMSKPAYGQLQIDCIEDNPVDKNMESVLKRSPDMEKLARAFAATLKGTYEMTPDNYFLPTGGMFKAINGGTSFKLY